MNSSLQHRKPERSCRITQAHAVLQIHGALHLCLVVSAVQSSELYSIFSPAGYLILINRSKYSSSLTFNKLQEGQQGKRSQIRNKIVTVFYKFQKQISFFFCFGLILTKGRNELLLYDIFFRLENFTTALKNIHDLSVHDYLILRLNLWLPLCLKFIVYLGSTERDMQRSHPCVGSCLRCLWQLQQGQGQTQDLSIQFRIPKCMAESELPQSSLLPHRCHLVAVFVGSWKQEP